MATVAPGPEKTCCITGKMNGETLERGQKANLCSSSHRGSSRYRGGANVLLVFGDPVSRGLQGGNQWRGYPEADQLPSDGAITRCERAAHLIRARAPGFCAVRRLGH